jgi:hypothetical protein
LIPTAEERDFIDEAFRLFPSDKISSKAPIPKAEPDIEPNIKDPSRKLILGAELKNEPTDLEKPIEKNEPTGLEKPIEKNEPTDLEKPMEKNEPSVFGSKPPTSFPETDTSEKESDLIIGKKIEPETEPMDAKIEVKQRDEPERTEALSEDESPDEKGILVKADEDAIEAALNKHSDREDKTDSFRQADEETIVDRVLNQKKKGKWSKK